MMLVRSLFAPGVLQMNDVIQNGYGTRAASPTPRARCRACSNGYTCRAT